MSNNDEPIAVSLRPMDINNGLVRVDEGIACYTQVYPKVYSTPVTSRLRARFDSITLITPLTGTDAGKMMYLYLNSIAA